MARVRRATGAGLPGLEPGDGCQAFPLVVRGMTHPPTVNNNSASLSPGDLGSPIVPGNRHFGVLSLLPACAVTQRYVCLLGLSKWTGPKVSCPVGALVHRGRAGSFDVGYTDWESCHTRPRLSLLQPFAGVARSPFVEAGGFPLEGRVNVAFVMRRLEPKLPGRLVSRRLTVS